jgi:hypothetical protein
MLPDASAHHSLFAKTVWAAHATRKIAWYVGYVETPDAKLIFAMAMDTRGLADLPLCQALVVAGLLTKRMIASPEAAPAIEGIDEGDTLRARRHHIRSIQHMWDERYADGDYAYGTLPNDFLVEQADRLPEGPILCLAEGEGRNAVRSRALT